MAYKLTGKVHRIGKVEVVSDKFQKRDLVILDDSSMYAQHINIQFTQDKCILLDNLQLGEEVEVSFNLRGREWTDPNGVVKVFNTVEGWKIDLKARVHQSTDPYYNPQPTQAPPIDDGDLPF